MERNEREWIGNYIFFGQGKERRLSCAGEKKEALEEGA